MSQSAWDEWARGENRCPECVGLPRDDFEAVCDCWQAGRERDRMSFRQRVREYGLLRALRS